METVYIVFGWSTMVDYHNDYEYRESWPEATFSTLEAAKRYVDEQEMPSAYYIQETPFMG